MVSLILHSRRSWFHHGNKCLQAFEARRCIIAYALVQRRRWWKLSKLTQAWEQSCGLQFQVKPCPWLIKTFSWIRVLVVVSSFVKSTQNSYHPETANPGNVMPSSSLKVWFVLRAISTKRCRVPQRESVHCIHQIYTSRQLIFYGMSTCEKSSWEDCTCADASFWGMHLWQLLITHTHIQQPSFLLHIWPADRLLRIETAAQSCRARLMCLCLLNMIFGVLFEWICLTLSLDIWGFAYVASLVLLACNCCSTLA